MAVIFFIALFLVLCYNMLKRGESMKKLFALIAVLLCCFVIGSAISVSAAGFSGAGGDFGHNAEQEQEYEEEYTSNEEAAATIFDFLYYLILGGTPITAYIIYQIKVSKAARASKKIMNMLDDADSAWKFKDVMPRFKQVFYGVKKAWSQADMDAACQFTTKDMYERLKMQLAWQEMRQQSSALKYIKLLDARPVAVFDSHDDACDHIWFYVEWRAVECGSGLGAARVAKTHQEFWKLIRDWENGWALADILDKAQGDKLIFSEDTQNQQNKTEV